MTCAPTATGPAVVGEVERIRLLRLLDAYSTSVVVISAPAGSGKSILARQWATRGSRAHATLRLAEHLDDPGALSRGLVDALEELGPAAPDVRACITGGEPAFSTTSLPALARLVQGRQQPFLLVLDDVHLLQNPAAHRVLEVVCEAVPPDSTIVLATRSLVPAWLARIRTTGRLSDLTAKDLAFDTAEARSLLEGMGVTLDEPVVGELLEHTEGWPVGIYLTALSLRSRHGGRATAPRLARGSDRSVSDYLRTEVLATLSDDERLFLTRSAVLDELTGSVCDAVLLRTDSARVLAHLHQRIQLLIGEDGHQPRYRCHHLLAEKLAADLNTFEPELVSTLHARASRWFDAHGDREPAVRHAIESGDTTLASRTIWPAVPHCIASGDIDRLCVWLGRLDDRQIAADRWLALAAAWTSLQRGDADGMRRWAGVAQAHAGQEWRAAARTDPYAATLAVLMSLAGAASLDDTRDLCDLALSGLPPDDSFRAAAAFNRGIALTLSRDTAAGMDSMREAEALARSLGVPVIEANAKSWMGLLALGAGHREQGIRLVSAGAEVTRRNHLDRLATGVLSVTAEALVLALMADKSAASSTLTTARRLTGSVGAIAPWFAVTGRLVQARTAALVGDGATARLLIAEARRHLTAELRDSLVGDSLQEAESVVARLAGHAGATGVLTTTELRVLQFLPSYLTLQQIGEHMFVSQSTVKTHVLSIYRKFGVNSRAEAVAHARSIGLVESAVDD